MKYSLTPTQFTHSLTITYLTTHSSLHSPYSSHPHLHLNSRLPLPTQTSPFLNHSGIPFSTLHSQVTRSWGTPEHTRPTQVLLTCILECGTACCWCWYWCSFPLSFTHSNSLPRQVHWGCDCGVPACESSVERRQHMYHLKAREVTEQPTARPHLRIGSYSTAHLALGITFMLIGLGSTCGPVAYRASLSCRPRI